MYYRNEVVIRMNDTAIQVNGISKIYKLYEKPTDRVKESFGMTNKKYHTEHYALEDVSFDVQKGEILGIIGTNGSGKSTLLKIITGVLNSSKGEIKVNGSISALLELGTGFNPEYTGMENIYLYGTLMGYTHEQTSKKVKDIIEFADIGDFINQPVKTYSSGMFARLAFAVSINVDPDILIVDEALSVGDIFFQAKCYKKFEEFRRNNKTIIFVTHDLGSVLKYCSRAVLLNKGKLLKDGTPKEVIDLYKRVLVGQEGEIVESNANTFEEKGIWKHELVNNTDLLEYGDKRAEIIDYCILDENKVIGNNIIKGRKFEIKMKIRFNDKILEPILAFTIKDKQGTELTGTNTKIEHKDLATVEAGEIIEVTFKQKMLLQGGTYLLSLGCTGFENVDFQVYHRLYDVCNINVVSDKDTVGFFDMESEVAIERRS